MFTRCFTPFSMKLSIPRESTDRHSERPLLLSLRGAKPRGSIRLLRMPHARPDPSTGAVRERVQLTIAVNVSRVSADSCVPLGGAMFEIWHCDAVGVYSDVNEQGFNTVGRKFLRGYQVADTNGRVQFTTVYPGWYQGRATHIHFKIRNSNQEFTSQFFFDDNLSDLVNARAPYSQKGAADGLKTRPIAFTSRATARRC
jgi:protocatechuate 3,4-dioxygenase beta subunit